MGVDFRGEDALVSEHFLDHPQVRTVLDRVAKLCRKVCGDISLWIPASIACFLTMSKIATLLIFRPKRFRNRMSSNCGDAL